MSIKLSDVRARQPDWFSRKNKRFFGDVSYRLLHSSSGKPFLVRSTYAWSDMFGHAKRLHWRLNAIEPDLKIGSLLESSFSSLENVKIFLRTL